MKTYTEGEILKALREKWNPPRGKTKAEVARELGFTDKYIYAVLAGSEPLTTAMVEVLGFHEAPRRFVRKDGKAAQ